MANQSSDNEHRHHHHHHRRYSSRPDTPGMFSGISRKTILLSCLFGLLFLTLLYLAWRG